MANLTTGESHQYCVNGTGGPLAVTLVWHDYPSALSAATTLVNDLDLTVRAAGLNGFPLYVRLSGTCQSIRLANAVCSNIAMSRQNAKVMMQVASLESHS